MLRRLVAVPVDMLEPTRETARRHHPNYCLREHVITTLGPAVSYRRRTTDEYDRKVMQLVRELSTINARLIRVAWTSKASQPAACSATSSNKASSSRPPPRSAVPPSPAEQDPPSRPSWPSDARTQTLPVQPHSPDRPPRRQHDPALI